MCRVIAANSPTMNVAPRESATAIHSARSTSPRHPAFNCVLGAVVRHGIANGAWCALLNAFRFITRNGIRLYGHELSGKTRAGRGPRRRSFSDGGADIREVQQYLNPEAEHYLDWFHITMRLTVMGQYAKGLDTTQENRQETLKSLESVKHYLWHGNVARARDRIEDIHCFLDNEELTGENSRKLRKALDEFDTYVVVNEALIPNYGERWRNEEAIATGFVESAVNQIVSKRFAKKQQMQWTKKSAHLVLQMRTQVLDERLEETFRDWYPDFRTKPPENEIKQAA